MNLSKEEFEYIVQLIKYDIQRDIYRIQEYVKGALKEMKGGDLKDGKLQ